MTFYIKGYLHAACRLSKQPMCYIIIFCFNRIETIRQHQYTYMKDLMELESKVPSTELILPAVLSSVVTPLHTPAWRAALSEHPDKDFERYVCTGLSRGFRIGFDRNQPTKSARANMPSASLHSEVIAAFLNKERSLGRIMGPFHDTRIQVNRCGVVPKGHIPGKWRVITDLSFPPNGSVNEGIDPILCSLTYLSIETVAHTVSLLGTGAMMAKIDIEAAYRLLPVHPQDRLLLGIEWNGEVFCDAMLPFGLRSAPKIFNAVADGLEWILQRKGINYLYHYLDDFIILGRAGSNQCVDDLAALKQVCSELGVPLAADKCAGPATCITFLGIEVDSVSGTLRLPADKLRRLLSTLHSWGDRKVCVQRELQSLIGLLNHACKVVRPGRSFLRRMIDLLSMSSQPHHCIRLNRHFRSDLAWWRLFTASWNGVGLIQQSDQGRGTQFSTDASGSWGCGAWCGPKWFQVKWGSRMSAILIAVKELIPIILAAAIWGQCWKGLVVTCHCDNVVAVSAVQFRSCRQQHIMHLLRCLFFVEARFDFQLRCVHIPGYQNDCADDLSRNHLPSFFAKVTGAHPLPSPVPPTLLELLVSQELDFLSPRWSSLFEDTFRAA